MNPGALQPRSLYGAGHHGGTMQLPVQQCDSDIIICCFCGISMQSLKKRQKNNKRQGKVTTTYRVPRGSLLEVFSTRRSRSRSANVTSPPLYTSRSTVHYRRINRTSGSAAAAKQQNWPRWSTTVFRTADK